MSEPIWDVESLYQRAKALAEKAGRELSIEHFWAIADADLAGSAPREIDRLVARAKNYIVFDKAIAKYGVPGDPDVDASIRRNEIFNSAEALKDNLDALRFLCKTNLLFLAREILNKEFTFYTHARLCNFFVQKDPSRALVYQDPVKDRLLLYPRGGFKSTLDMIDCVQWIINFPDVRILVLCSTDDLAEAFVWEVRKYFSVVEHSKPTVFQRLFPEFCIKPSSGSETEFICPCASRDLESTDDEKKEPTVWASSILSNLPGWHCDLAKIDDAVNDKNAATNLLIAKVIKKVNYAESLIDPGGYIDMIGTPYAPGDLYTNRKEVSDPTEIKILEKPAWWLKADSIHKNERDWTNEDLELLFEFDKLGTPRLTHKFLRKKKRQDVQIFNSQYLLNPAGVKKIKFTRELLAQRTISRDQLPLKLTYYILWDFAYAANKDNDYSVGAAIGLDEEGRAYVVEIFRDHYLDSELAREIASSNKTYLPRLVPIENSNGAQFLESSIRRYSDEMGISYIPLDFFKVDKTPNAKATRIGALQPLLVDGRLYFLNEIACLEDLYKEFEGFGSVPHDDIPDAVSHVHRVLPSFGAMQSNMEERKEKERKFREALAAKEFEDMIYLQGDYAIPEKPIEAPQTSFEDSGGNEPYDPYAVGGFK